MRARPPRITLVALAVALLLTAPASGAAAALKTIAPPGKAGADQYFETVPSAAGNARPPQSGASAGGLGAGASAGVRALAHSGREGQAAARFATASAATGKNLVGQPTTLPQASPSSSVVDVLTGSDAGGLGVALPLLLGTLLVAAVGLGVALLRRSDEAA